jgi:hypothetical protein
MTSNYNFTDNVSLQIVLDVIAEFLASVSTLRD